MKSIVFDFDGTIADTLPVMFHSFRKVFKTYDNVEYSNEEIKEMFGPPEPELIKQNLKSEQKEKAIELYYKEYEENHHKLVKEYQEITDLLSSLKKQGFNLGIVTGKSKRSFTLSLEKLNMKKFFDVAITGYEVHQAKPDPEGILTALRKLDTNPEAAMYIGDSDSDIQAAKEAGVTVAAAQWLPEFESSDYTREPDAVFKHPSQLIDFLSENN